MMYASGMASKTPLQGLSVPTEVVTISLGHLTGSHVLRV